jgi:sigma-B regulation protein RsbU (phosphoserine phosphatase)
LTLKGPGETGPDLASPLFHRYRRRLRLTFAVVAVLAAAVLAAGAWRDYQSALALEASRMLSGTRALGALMGGGAERVLAIRDEAEAWLRRHPAASPSRRDVDMVAVLNPLLAVALRTMPGVSRVYAVSDADFPDTSAAPSVRERGLMAAVRPENDPDRGVSWTPVILDETGPERAGAGLLVTASAPVYDGDRFLGAICLDITLVRLNEALAALRSPYSERFIVNDRGQLVAHPRLIAASDRAVKRLEDAFPSDMRDRAAKIVAEATAITDIGRALGRWHLDAAPIAGTPFSVVVMVSDAAVLRAIAGGSVTSLGLLLAGLGAMLLMATGATRREFIRPSEQLVRYIEDESRGTAAGMPAAVPAAWRPWFETIARVFEDHAQLVSIRKELDVARRIQHAILPGHFPDRADVRIFARMTAAREVGGDFYDVFWLDERRIGFVVADVSDKGVPAALFMAVSRTLLRAVAPATAGPGACLARANDLLARDNEQSMFVTVFYGILDTADGRLVFANGGHNPPVLVSADGGCRVLKGGSGLALGVMEGVTYADRDVMLAPGASLVCFSDGVTDAADRTGEVFGEARLMDVLAGCGDLRPPALIERIGAVLDAFAAGAPPSDDITCLAVRWRDAGGEVACAAPAGEPETRHMG